MKTARFTDVVAAAGRPQVHSLWMAPDKDPELRRAVRDCRVMTLHQQLRGTKKDYGTVGLHLDGATQVLVFPKSLRRFGERHIVGVDYKLVIQPEPKDPAPPEAFRPAKKAKTATKPARPVAHAKRAIEPTPPARVEREHPPKPKQLTRDALIAEVRRAVKELKAGKAVAAYERLRAVADEA
jgi:hypothetical protein